MSCDLGHDAEAQADAEAEAEVAAAAMAGTEAEADAIAIVIVVPCWFSWFKIWGTPNPRQGGRKIMSEASRKHSSSRSCRNHPHRKKWRNLEPGQPQQPRHPPWVYATSSRNTSVGPAVHGAI